MGFEDVVGKGGNWIRGGAGGSNVIGYGRDGGRRVGWWLIKGWYLSSKSVPLGTEPSGPIETTMGWNTTTQLWVCYGAM